MKDNEYKGNIKQIILLTHNVYFHKEVSYMDRGAESDKLNYWILRKNGNISSIEPYDKKNPIKSSYQLLWKELQSKSVASTITIQNIMRRILENYFKVLGSYKDEEKIKEFVSYILTDEYKEEFDKNEYYLSLLITTNAQIQEINREYRQKDTPTDVISFAYNETENFGAMNMLGDIVISIERVKEQSSEYGHSDEREFYYVLCHGMLHLLGYDHIEEEDKVVMRRREEEILSKFNYNR